MEHPILFNTDMVNAILERRKRCTRRIVKPQPDDRGLWNDDKYPRSLQSTLNGWNGTTNEDGESREWKCRYGNPGDILWVKESFIRGYEMKDGIFKTDEQGEYIERVWYKATDVNLNWYDGSSDFPMEEVPWKSSLFMPKKIARIWLQVTDVRVERLRDISEEDAIQEGVDHVDKLTILGYQSSITETIMIRHYKNYLTGLYGEASPIDSFQTLFCKINGEESWKENPWVWVIEFDVLSTTGRPDMIS